MERQNERMVGYFTSCTECYCPSVHNSKPRLRFWPEKPQCALSPAPAPVPSPSPNPTRSPAQSPSPNPTPSPWPDGDGVCCAPYQSWGQSYYYVPTWPLCRKPTVSPRTPMSSFSAEMVRMEASRAFTVAAHPHRHSARPPRRPRQHPHTRARRETTSSTTQAGPQSSTAGVPPTTGVVAQSTSATAPALPTHGSSFGEDGGQVPAARGATETATLNTPRKRSPASKSYQGELYNCFNCRIRRDLLPADFDDIRFSSLPVTARRYDSSDRKGAWGQNLWIVCDGDPAQGRGECAPVPP